jgi:glycine dehydrogenase subunit 1
MLTVIGVQDMEELFASIPDSIRFKGSLKLPEGLSEMEVTQRIKELGSRNRPATDMPFFLGAGSYRHFIPALVSHLAHRSEFVTAYTPYQPELSQGALQAIFEYQTMICMLTGFDISNASMYDGASAFAEAGLMAVDGTGRKRIMVSQTVHPEYREVLKAYFNYLGVEIIEIPFAHGRTDLKTIDPKAMKGSAALLFQHPNFFGCLEEVEALADLARKNGALSIVSVDPISLSILNPPARYGTDIATGEGQSLGVPMSFGGPGFGFLACHMDRVRRLPGRIVGQTLDGRGRPAYVLTFQAREQHIRRERATSNICTNHALNALRALVYLAALGRTGFRKLGETITAKSHQAAKTLAALKGYELIFETPFFKEFAVRCPCSAHKINAALLENQIIGGYELGNDYPGMDDVMLLCVTEMTQSRDVNRLAEILKGF